MTAERTAERDKPVSLAETLDEKNGEAMNPAMPTTLVQPIRLPRQSDPARTRHWERLSFDRDEPKRPAASYGIGGNTHIGLGPDDEIQQAVKAAKLQRVEPETRSPGIPAGADLILTSDAKTMQLPAIDVLQLIAAKATARIAPESAAREPELQFAPARRLRPVVLVCAALSVMLSVISVSYLVPIGASGARRHSGGAGPATEVAEPTAATATPAKPEAEPVPKAVGATAPAKAIAVQPTEAATASAGAASQTTEKAAVDALFAGDYALARRHYASLATGHPEQPAFVEAARILRRNAAAAAE